MHVELVSYYGSPFLMTFYLNMENYTTQPYYLDTYIVEKGALGPEYEWATLILVFSRDGLGQNPSQGLFGQPAISNFLEPK